MTHNRTLLIMARPSKDTVLSANRLRITKQCSCPIYPHIVDLTLNTEHSCSFSSFTASVHSCLALLGSAASGRLGVPLQDLPSKVALVTMAT